MQNCNSKLKIIVAYSFVVSCLLLVICNSAYAARFYFEPGSSALLFGENVAVDLKLDSEGAEINVLEAEILFNGGAKIVDLSNGDSFVSYWVANPEAKDGKIYFSGAVPGGYNAKDGRVLRIILSGSEGGTVSFSKGDKTMVLLNDGKATKADLSFAGADFIFRPDGGRGADFSAKDSLPPEPFSPVLSRDESVYGGKYFLVFNTQDKDSGVGYYEVAETSDDSPPEEGWVRTSSPYILKDQALKKNLFIRVVDNAGNTRIEAMKTTPGFPGIYAVFALLGIITVLGGVVLLKWEKLVLFLKKRDFWVKK